MPTSAESRTADDAYVLLIVDRPREWAAMERAIAKVVRCRRVSAGDALPVERPHVAVLDGAAAQAVPLAYRGPPVPCLVLVRGTAGPPAPHLRYIPANAPPQAVLAALFAMVEAASRSADALSRRLRACNEAATATVTELFDSAALGAPLYRADVERGTDLVLEAVSEAGIADWLAEVWRHGAGVYQHTLSVAGYAAVFGARIGLGRTDLARLTRAALLHDIGKARIPAEILNKPGPLDAVEQRLMRRHPEIGANLLAAQGGFEPEVVGVVRHHHERLDGGGYPDGLSGDAIGDLVRIVAICDVFSALTERRAYRQPFNAEEALGVMTEDRGHLDPDLLRAFAPAMLGTDALAA